jgi:hypothetical protein
VLRSVQPPVILPSGGTALRVLGENFTPRTRLMVGLTQRAAVLLPDQVVHSATEIQATSLPGEGRTNLYAVDPDVGWSALEGALTFTTPGTP